MRKSKVALAFLILGITWLTRRSFWVSFVKWAQGVRAERRKAE